MRGGRIQSVVAWPTENPIGPSGSVESDAFGAGVDEFFDTQREFVADASPDGRRLAVLTYDGVWVFETSEKERWFDGSIRWIPTEDEDAEAITLDGDQLIISAGEGDGYLYEIPISSLIQVRK